MISTTTTELYHIISYHRETRRRLQSNSATFSGLLADDAGLADDASHQDVGINVVVEGVGLANDSRKAGFATFDNKL